MNDQRKSFTFIWKIRNFNFSYNCQLCSYKSPIFFVPALCTTRWRLEIIPCASNLQNYVFCNLQRQYKDFGPNRIEIDYEFAFISTDGSVIHSEVAHNITFKTGSFGPIPLSAKIEDVYMNLKEVFIPDNTLTIRCRMWKSQGTIADSVTCFVETPIDTKCTSFNGTIQQLSSIKPKSTNTVCIESSQKYFSMDLCFADDGKLDIKIEPFYSRYYEIKVFIIDVLENKVKACQGEIYERHAIRIPFKFSKEFLIENKELYLLHDVLTLQCEVTFCSGFVPRYDNEKIGALVYEYHSQDSQAVASNTTNANSFSKEHHAESFTTLKGGTNATDTNPSDEYNTESGKTLKDDLMSLFNEGILCDTKLKTGTETFPAHTVVLSARSPVFKSMFATDMREKRNNCVDIEDLDAGTVRQMLLFIYSDSLDNLDYENAKSLYFAADKYNIVLLKHKCSNILKEKLLYSNCCDVLLLADIHQDRDLKRSVQDYIAENDEVFSSNEWIKLEENHPRLTTEILRAAYMKNRRT